MIALVQMGNPEAYAKYWLDMNLNPVHLYCALLYL